MYNYPQLHKGGVYNIVCYKDCIWKMGCLDNVEIQLIDDKYEEIRNVIFHDKDREYDGHTTYTVLLFKTMNDTGMFSIGERQVKSINVVEN
jgi:hypothetical protein